MKYWYCYFCKH